ncbi:hypothetical protein AB0A77_37285 [Streptomyces varsoviensis]|uniref:hypothetical protein n=1 Tax=Streptomyces varsoviensis TaxID=67373 RepID=UPI0033C69D3A
MTVSPPTPATVAQKPPKDHTRLWATLLAVLFIPALLCASLAAWSSERAQRCTAYGECPRPGLPGWMFEGGIGLGVVALVVALTAPRTRVRQVAVTVQLLSEVTALLVILS